MTHYDPETLFDYLNGTSPRAAEIEAHLSSCPACATQAAEWREWLGETPAHERAGEDLPAINPGHIGEIVALAERLEWEGEVAPALCDEILAGPEAWWLQHVRKTAGTQTAGIIRYLLERVRSTIEQSPARATQITTLALQLAEELDPTAYPREYVDNVHGQALRSRALMLSFTGRYHEALECAGRAQALFESVPGTSFELARLAMVKASALQYVERAEEGMALLRAAAATFRAHGEHLWSVDARITEGSVMYNTGAVERALEIWRAVASHPLLDEIRTVRLTHNIALCHADLGHPAEAIPAATRCVAEFERLNMPSERTRSRMLLGRALIASGRPADALPVLRKSRREYLELSLTVEAGVAALELAEALLAINRPYEVPTICRELIAEFTKAGMRTPAITALAYLNEAVALGKVSAQIVRDARLSLGRHCAEQPRLFAPGPAGRTNDPRQD